MSSGSLWRIWDLHVHTPHSVLNNQFGDPMLDSTWDTYASRLEDKARERGIAAIGLTDYFTIEGYEHAIALQGEGRLNGLLLLPNIEFRVDKVVYRGINGSDPKRLNLHVIFSPTVSPAEIREHFLDDLEFVHEQDPWSSAQKRKLKRSNLTDFGAKLQKDHEEFRGRDPFEVGCLNAVVNPEMLKGILDNRFRGRHLLVLAEETLPLLDWNSQDHAIRKQLLQMAHAIFSANPKTREFCLGLRHATPTEFKEEFKSIKPCLWGCDAHGYSDRFLAPDMDRYCWIKGDVTWEGLKQVLFEPADRVVIQANSPEATKSIHTISRVSIPPTAIRPSLSIGPFDLHFNPNLVAIIGGRGSGKTALLDIIATCFPEGTKLLQLPTSFMYRLYAQDPPLGEGDSAPVPVSLYLASGEAFTKQAGLENTHLIDTDVLYLTQNHFDEYSSDPRKLSGYIIDLVFQHFAEEKRRLQLLEASLTERARQIAEASLKAEHLTSQISVRKKQEADELATLMGTKADLVGRIGVVEASRGSQAERADALSSALHGFIARDIAITAALEILNQAKPLAESFLSDYASVSKRANEAVGRVGNDMLGNPLTSLPVALPDVTALVATIGDHLGKLESAARDVAERLILTRVGISELEGLDKDLADLKEAHSNAIAQIDDLNARIAETRENEARLETFLATRLGLFAEQMALTVQIRSFLQAVIARFRASNPNVLANISFDASISLQDFPSYVHELAILLDNRVTSEDALNVLLAPLRDSIERSFSTTSSAADFLPGVTSLSATLDSLKKKGSVRPAQFADAAFSRFFRVTIPIIYSGKRMEDLSMGERAIVLLRILLALGDYPLLIDQPEEHLDNRYVFDDLTPAFREAKGKRQIIMATHNANLVVNTDAEQVIVAEDQGGRLQYVSGTLEDLSIRDRITTILEGGDEAFRRREQRYGYVY